MTPDNREEQVREALGRVTQMVAPGAEWVEIEAADWATIRAHIEALEAKVQAVRDVCEEWNADARAEGFGGGNTRARIILDAIAGASQ